MHTTEDETFLPCSGRDCCGTVKTGCGIVVTGYCCDNCGGSSGAGCCNVVAASAAVWCWKWDGCHFESITVWGDCWKKFIESLHSGQYSGQNRPLYKAVNGINILMKSAINVYHSKNVTSILFMCHSLKQLNDLITCKCCWSVVTGGSSFVAGSVCAAVVCAVSPAAAGSAVCAAAVGCAVCAGCDVWAAGGCCIDRLCSARDGCGRNAGTWKYAETISCAIKDPWDKINCTEPIQLHITSVPLSGNGSHWVQRERRLLWIEKYPLFSNPNKR